MFNTSQDSALAQHPNYTIHIYKVIAESSKWERVRERTGEMRIDGRLL